MKDTLIEKIEIEKEKRKPMITNLAKPTLNFQNPYSQQ